MALLETHEQPGSLWKICRQSRPGNGVETLETLLAQNMTPGLCETEAGPAHRGPLVG